MLAQSKNPSVDAVRVALGNTGSKNHDPQVPQRIGRGGRRY
ncbi:DNA-binding protein [Undibacterium arcticum]